MSSEPAIRVRHLSKSYQIYERPGDRLKQFVWRGRRQFYRDFWALHDVTFDVPHGSTVGIVGRNGSGKSTLLQLICGTLTPTSGSVELNGRIAALLELGAGFNPEFTGRENIFLYGAVLGLTEAEIRARVGRIMEFADIGDFIEMPVKTYSSGMHVRLAFSVAINVDPDILIVDEALAVGDARFQQRCMTKLRELQQRGVSILFVSHDAESVKRLCEHVIVLQDGAVVNQGDAPAMANWYLALTTVDYDLERLRRMQEDAAARDAASNASPPGAAPLSLPSEPPASELQARSVEFTYFRHGDGSCRITDSYIADGHSHRTEVVTLGGSASIVVEVEFLSAQLRHLVGVVIRDRLGTTVIGINTWQERVELPEAQAGDRYRYIFTMPIDLRPGYYSVSPAVAYHQDVQQWMDSIENATIFRVIDDDRRRTVFGIYLPAHREIQVSRLPGPAPHARPSVLSTTHPSPGWIRCDDAIPGTTRYDDGRNRSRPRDISSVRALETPERIERRAAGAARPREFQTLRQPELLQLAPVCALRQSGAQAAQAVGATSIARPLHVVNRAARSDRGVCACARPGDVARTVHLPAVRHPVVGLCASRGLASDARSPRRTGSGQSHQDSP